VNFNLVVGVRNAMKQFGKDSEITLDNMMDTIEGAFVRLALDQADGNLTEAAEILGINYRSIRYRAKKLYINTGKDMKN